MASEVRTAESAAATSDPRLDSIEQVVKDLHRQVGEMSEETITPAELTVVPGLHLHRPIPIVIEESAEDVLARWVEPGLTGIGGSEGEAIESLAAIILEVWKGLRADDVTGRNAQRVLTVIENYAAPAP